MKRLLVLIFPFIFGCQTVAISVIETDKSRDTELHKKIPVEEKEKDKK